MRVVVISDAHLVCDGDPAARDLVAWLGALEADELVLLGDIFHAWWGWDHVVPARLVGVLGALRGVQARGTRITVLRGNHDFRPGPFFTEVLGAAVSGPVMRDLDGLRVQLAHGDEADRRLGYRLVRRLLQGRAFAGGMRVLGADRGQRLLSQLAAGAEGRGLGGVVERQRVWARARLKAGADLVVLGHSHVLGREALEGGQLVCMGSWLGDRSWLELEQGRVRLLGRDGVEVPPGVVGAGSEPQAPQ